KKTFGLWRARFLDLPSPWDCAAKPLFDKINEPPSHRARRVRRLFKPPQCLEQLDRAATASQAATRATAGARAAAASATAAAPAPDGAFGSAELCHEALRALTHQTAPGGVGLEVVAGIQLAVETCAHLFEMGAVPDHAIAQLEAGASVAQPLLKGGAGVAVQPALGDDANLIVHFRRRQGRVHLFHRGSLPPCARPPGLFPFKLPHLPPVPLFSLLACVKGGVPGPLYLDLSSGPELV